MKDFFLRTRKEDHYEQAATWLGVELAAVERAARATEQRGRCPRTL